MPDKITLTNLTGSFASVADINANFTAVADIINNELLSRNNRVSTAANQLESDIDVNSKRLYNIPNGTEPSHAVNLAQLTGVTALTEYNGIAIETATATAGQTVFNLGTVTYTAGLNSLAVYINGVRQRQGTDYTETDSDTVTFLSGLDEGDSLLFIVNEVVADTSTVTANNTTITINGVSTNVSSYLNNKYATSYADLRTKLGNGVLAAGDMVQMTDPVRKGVFSIESRGSDTDDDAVNITDGGTLIAKRITDGVYRAEWWGVVSDATDQATPDGTDNAVALQAFFDYMRGRQGTFILPPSDNGKFIYTSSGINMTVDGSSEDTYSPILDGNNNIITMRGSGSSPVQVLKVGALSNSNIPGGQKIVIKNLELRGPLIGDASWTPKTYTAGNPSITTDGMFIENWINIELQNVVVQGCFRGFRNRFAFPITEINCRAENCYEGWKLEGDVTARTSIRCRALSCRWACTLQPDDPVKEVYGQTFYGFHLENCLMGIIVDPGSGASGNGVRDVVFRDTYVEGLGYNDGSNKTDVFRLGKSYDIADVTDGGTNRTKNVINFIFEPTQESYQEEPTIGGLQASISTGGNVKGVEVRSSFLVPEGSPFATPSIAGWGSALSAAWHPTFLRSIGTQDYTRYPGESMFNLKVDNAAANGAITPTWATGGVTIAKTASGVYTITLPYANSAQFDFAVWTQVDRAAFVTVDPKTTQTWEMRVYDAPGGTLSASEPRINCLIKQPH